uniref:Uncharacterized protein n=1 Tax=Arundo donax TaxID=35708 RepID=A0A0A8Y6K9_ARUDO
MPQNFLCFPTCRNNLPTLFKLAVPDIGKMILELINANPVVYEKKERCIRPSHARDEDASELIDQQEIFDIFFNLPFAQSTYRSCSDFSFCTMHCPDYFALLKLSTSHLRYKRP